MVSDVPGSVWLLVLGSAAVCLAAATACTARAAHLRAGDVRTWAWAGLLALIAAALVWSGLYDAAVSTIGPGAPIPIFHWLFSLAPAVLAGWLFAPCTRSERYAAALGTGVVSVPLLTLSFALFDPPGLSPAAVVTPLFMGAVLGVVPLIGGVALAGVIGRPQDLPAVTPGSLR